MCQHCDVLKCHQLYSLQEERQKERKRDKLTQKDRIQRSTFQITEGTHQPVEQHMEYLP
jgi:hypothetical protein